MAKKPKSSGSSGDAGSVAGEKAVKPTKKSAGARSKAAREVAGLLSEVEAPRAAAEAPAWVPLHGADGVIGHAGAISLLDAASASGRVHHAWIFHGPRGVGKFTTARAFGASLLEPRGGAAGDEGAERARELLRRGTHPDLHVIQKELATVSRDERVRERKLTNIPRAVVEEFLMEPASRTRVMRGETAAGKVFIVDEAELLDAGTQNLLLKTMEEPPTGCVIILVTSSEDELLPTVRSRCQRVGFGALSEAEMAAWMRRAGVETAGEERAWVLGYAGGSPGTAKEALEHGLFEWARRIEPMLDELVFEGNASSLAETVVGLVEERAEAHVKANKGASKDAANKAWTRRMLTLMNEHVRRRLREAVGRGGTGEERGRAGVLLDAIDRLSAAEVELDTHVRFSFVMENAAAQIGMAARTAGR